MKLPSDAILSKILIGLLFLFVILGILFDTNYN